MGVPGLAAGLWTAHQKWGSKSWAKEVEPAITLAQVGFRVLPKSRDLFEEQHKKIRRGDAEIARLYLPVGAPLASGLLRLNSNLARTLTLLAQQGRDGFTTGGGAITLDDLAGYTAHLSETGGIDFRHYRIERAPPPASGAAMFMPARKVLEEEVIGPASCARRTISTGSAGCGAWLNRRTAGPSAAQRDRANAGPAPGPAHLGAGRARGRPHPHYDAPGPPRRTRAQPPPERCHWGHAVHFMMPWKEGEAFTFEAEQSFPAIQTDLWWSVGWKIDLSEPDRPRPAFWRHQRL
ncbi:MAG: Gamma-glutamyltranspeptidase [Verrucomicrobia bacterium]|nr:MAG: Gamma-glutamyltranspeptidase [Verrucomicrobiota bacterium]